MEAGRLNAYKAAPDAMRAVQRVEAYIQQCGLEKNLIELVKMRASQINGCAYCLDVHSKDARRGGETEQRLYLLDSWHESPLYTERERAALAWTKPSPALRRLTHPTRPTTRSAGILRIKSWSTSPH
jgi:AhpD family alkylhydroperoxidase